MPSRLASLQAFSADAAAFRPDAGRLSGRQLLNLVGCSLVFHLAGVLLVAYFGTGRKTPPPDQPLMVELKQLESATERALLLSRKIPVPPKPAVRPIHPASPIRTSHSSPPIAAVPMVRKASPEAVRTAGAVPVSRPDAVPVIPAAILPAARPATQPPVAGKQTAETLAVQRESNVPSMVPPPTRPKTEEIGGVIEVYRAKIRALIEQHKEYPVTARRGRMEGVVSVRFVLNRGGVLHQAEIVRSSGRGILDKAALRAVEETGNFPPVPDELKGGKFPFEVSLRYTLGNDRK